MAELYYVGKDPSQPRDVTNRIAVDEKFATGVSRDLAQEHLDDAVDLKASKVYADTNDSLYAEEVYHTNQNALLIPNAQRGQPNGVASLDQYGKIPSQQVPFLGSGIFRGPYGPATTPFGATGSTPLKVAEWPATVYGVTGYPLVFMNIATQCSSDRTVIEVKIGTAAQTTYASQTLIARGFSRGLYTDWQTITVMPIAPVPGEVPTAYANPTPWLINAWMHNTGTGSSQTTNGQVSTACLIWARSTQ